MFDPGKCGKGISSIKKVHMTAKNSRGEPEYTSIIAIRATPVPRIHPGVSM
jgi:hypothetical protein